MADEPSRPVSTPTTNGAGSTKRSGAARSVSVGQILAAILLVFVVVFIIENTTEVEIRIIAGPKVRVPVYVAILIATVVGALIAALLRYRRQRHRQNR